MRDDHLTSGDAGSPWAVVAAVLVGGATVTIALLTQAGGWLVDQVLLLSGLDRFVPLWPLAALFTVLLIGAATLPLALVPRSTTIRAAGRGWLVGALAMGVLGLLRTIPPVHHEAYLAALAVTAALLALLAHRLSPRLAPAPRPARPGPLPPPEWHTTPPGWPTTPPGPTGAVPGPTGAGPESSGEQPV
ncbi:hypothetical protein EYA84_21515, partial [Verrucosispora sp. SN26_14.1]